MSITAPVATIVIPTMNEGEFLPICLECIWQGTVKPPDVEVIIVDGGSTDDTLDWARYYECRVAVDDRSLGSARDTGTCLAKSDKIIQLDADAFVGKHYVERVCQLLDGNDFVFTAFDTIRDTYRPDWLSNLAHHRMTTPTGHSMGYTRRAYDLAGGFPLNYNLGEDTALYEAAKKAGLRIYYCDECASLHVDRRAPIYHLKTKVKDWLRIAGSDKWRTTDDYKHRR